MVTLGDRASALVFAALEWLLLAVAWLQRRIASLPGRQRPPCPRVGLGLGAGLRVGVATTTALSREQRRDVRQCLAELGVAEGDLLLFFPGAQDRGFSCPANTARLDVLLVQQKPPLVVGLRPTQVVRIPDLVAPKALVAYAELIPVERLDAASLKDALASFTTKAQRFGQ